MNSANKATKIKDIVELAKGYKSHSPKGALSSEQLLTKIYALDKATGGRLKLDMVLDVIAQYYGQAAVEAAREAFYDKDSRVFTDSLNRKPATLSTPPTPPIDIVRLNNILPRDSEYNSSPEPTSPIENTIENTRLDLMGEMQESYNGLDFD